MCDIYIQPMTVVKWNLLMNNKTQSQKFEWIRQARRINKMIHDFKYKCTKMYLSLQKTGYIVKTS